MSVVSPKFRSIKSHYEEYRPQRVDPLQDYLINKIELIMKQQNFNVDNKNQQKLTQIQIYQNNQDLEKLEKKVFRQKEKLKQQLQSGKYVVDVSKIQGQKIINQNESLAQSQMGDHLQYSLHQKTFDLDEPMIVYDNVEANQSQSNNSRNNLNINNQENDTSKSYQKERLLSPKLTSKGSMMMYSRMFSPQHQRSMNFILEKEKNNQKIEVQQPQEEEVILNETEEYIFQQVEKQEIKVLQKIPAPTKNNEKILLKKCEDLYNNYKKKKTYSNDNQYLIYLQQLHEVSNQEELRAFLQQYGEADKRHISEWAILFRKNEYNLKDISKYMKYLHDKIEQQKALQAALEEKNNQQEQNKSIQNSDKVQNEQNLTDKLEAINKNLDQQENEKQQLKSPNSKIFSSQKSNIFQYITQNPLSKTLASPTSKQQQQIQQKINKLLGTSMSIAQNNESQKNQNNDDNFNNTIDVKSPENVDSNNQQIINSSNQIIGNENLSNQKNSQTTNEKKLALKSPKKSDSIINQINSQYKNRPIYSNNVHDKNSQNLQDLQAKQQQEEIEKQNQLMLFEQMYEVAVIDIQQKIESINIKTLISLSYMTSPSDMIQNSYIGIIGFLYNYLPQQPKNLIYQPTYQWIDLINNIPTPQQLLQIFQQLQDIIEKDMGDKIKDENLLFAQERLKQAKLNEQQQKQQNNNQQSQYFQEISDSLLQFLESIINFYFLIKSNQQQNEDQTEQQELKETLINSKQDKQDNKKKSKKNSSKQNHKKSNSTSKVAVNDDKQDINQDDQIENNQKKEQENNENDNSEENEYAEVQQQRNSSQKKNNIKNYDKHIQKNLKNKEQKNKTSPLVEQKLKEKYGNIQSKVKQFLTMSQSNSNQNTPGRNKYKEELQQEIYLTKKEIDDIQAKSPKQRAELARKRIQEEKEQRLKEQQELLKREKELDSKFKEYVQQKEFNEKIDQKNQKREHFDYQREVKHLQELQKKLDIEENYINTINNSNWEKYKQLLNNIEHLNELEQHKIEHQLKQSK